jgi:phage/plasmid-like protein (TIGR03299 family)
MAYAGELPWHGLGVPVSNDMSAYEMMEAAQLNWTVKKVPMFRLNNNVIEQDNLNQYHGGMLMKNKMALIREEDNTELDVVGKNWHPVQNQESFDFFYDWVEEGKMEMHTAGSLSNGKIVWILAKVNETFEVVKDDVVESYMLFTNPHSFGTSLNVRFTPIRVVCNNTLQLALGQHSNGIRLDHTKKFDPHMVKDALGLATNSMIQYSDQAKHLVNKMSTKESRDEYFSKLFPMTHHEQEVKGYVRSKKAAYANRLHNNGTPGAGLVKDSWWDTFNTVTYMYDHKLGKSNASRVRSSWYGDASKSKQEALTKALQYADVA